MQSETQSVCPHYAISKPSVCPQYAIRTPSVCHQYAISTPHRSRFALYMRIETVDSCRGGAASP